MTRFQLRFPNATPADKAKTLILRQHFRNWDADPQKSRRQHRRKLTHPDDLAMAIWPGWIHAKGLIERAVQAVRKQQRPLPEVVRRRWDHRTERKARVGRQSRPSSQNYRDVDLMQLYLEGGDQT